MEERPAKRPRAARNVDVADPGPSSPRPPEATYADAERSSVPVEVECDAAEPFPLSQLPPELLASVLEAAGAREAWRLRSVCRAWKAAAEGVEWRPFELEVRSAEAAVAVANAARAGRLAVRGEMDVRVAITEQLLANDPRPVDLLASLASVPAGGTWSLRDVDVSVRIDVWSFDLVAVVLGVVFGLLRALQPAAGPSPIRSLAFQCECKRVPNADTEAPHEEVLLEAGKADKRTISELLSRFPRLESLLLPGSYTKSDLVPHLIHRSDSYVSYAIGSAVVAALVASLGPQLRRLRLGSAGASEPFDWLLRFPLLDSLEDACLSLEDEDDAGRVLRGLPNLRRVSFDAFDSAALRGLAAALPQARALRDLELDAVAENAESERALAEAAGASAAVLRDLWITLSVPASPTLLRSIAACQRLQALRLQLDFQTLEGIEAYSELAGLPRLSKGIQVLVCSAAFEVRDAACRALQAALTPCRQAGTDVRIQGH